MIYINLLQDIYIVVVVGAVDKWITPDLCPEASLLTIDKSATKANLCIVDKFSTSSDSVDKLWINGG